MSASTDSSESTAVRDLMGLLALPALWAGKDGETVVRIMIEAVFSIAPIHTAFAQITVPPGNTVVTLFKGGAGRADRTVPSAWQPLVDACVEQGSATRLTTRHSPAGPVKLLHLQMGAGRHQAHVWFASTRYNFPSANEAALLRAAASLAASGVNAARTEYDRVDAQRAKDEFLAMLGHELRNPLAPIVTTLGLIRIKGAGPLARECEVIERQVGHLSRLVDDLLDITRITRDRVELRRELFDMGRAVTEAVEGVSSLLEERHHRMTVTTNSSAVVDADPARIRQVLSNLLINAAKYTPPDGHIQVLVSCRTDAVEVTVQDNGTGIDSALLPRVFDLFEQGPTTIDRARGGLGIGLAIVKKIVALHGGHVTARSDGPGMGSRFTVSLPLASAVAPLQAPVEVAPEPPSPGRRLRVLVVDDNADARETMGLLLDVSGYEVATAGDPAEALQMAQSFKADVYLLDIGLPGLDGYQLATELRRLGGPAANSRFIALTGYGQASDRARTMAAGFHQHLVKPVSFELLLAALTD